jgi:hypothetical protein
LIKKKQKKQKQASIGEEETTEEFLYEQNSLISGRVLQVEELTTKDKAYQDIQEARGGYNTPKAYCAKQVVGSVECVTQIDLF